MTRLDAVTSGETHPPSDRDDRRYDVAVHDVLDKHAERCWSPRAPIGQQHPRPYIRVARVGARLIGCPMWRSVSDCTQAEVETMRSARLKAGKEKYRSHPFFITSLLKAETALFPSITLHQWPSRNASLRWCPALRSSAPSVSILFKHPSVHCLKLGAVASPRQDVNRLSRASMPALHFMIESLAYGDTMCSSSTPTALFSKVRSPMLDASLVVLLGPSRWSHP